MSGGNDFVIGNEFLRGRQNETFVKELCVASAAVSQTFRFKSPYKMADHGSSQNGLNWADGMLNIKIYTLSLLKPWPVSHTSTPTACLIVNLCRTYATAVS